MSDANQEQELVAEGQTAQADAQPETNPEEVVEPQAGEEELKLPDGVTERASEQFEKLKEHNKQLAIQNAEKDRRLAELEASKKAELPNFFNNPVPTSAQFTGLSQEQINHQAQSFVDKDGYLDVDSLNRVLQQTNERALRAEMEAKRTRQEVETYSHSQEVRQAHAEYPELDGNNENFDQKFFDLVTNHMYGQHMQGKKQPNFLESAKQVASTLYDPKAIKAQAATAKEQSKEESKTKRVQATTQVGQGKGQPLPLDQDELVEQSRKGSMDAIYKRLQASGN